MGNQLNILIVLLGSIGDVVRGLAVAQQIKRQAPNCHLTWVVEPKSEGVVRLARCIDEIIVFNRRAPITGSLALVKELRARQFDVTLDLQRHFKSGVISYLSGAKRRIGFHKNNTKEFNWIFQTNTIEERDDGLNKFLHYQEFLSSLELPKADSPLIDLNCELPQPKIRFEAPYVAMVMGTSWESKDWIKESYIECAGKLLNMSHGVVLVGDSTQRQLAEEIESKFIGANIQSFAGRTDLKELMGLLKGARVALGPDSGPGHIAAMLGKKYVSIFGPTSPRRVAPYGSEQFVVSANVGCSPCYLRVCPGLNKICMRLVPVEEVCEKVQIAIMQSFE